MYLAGLYPSKVTINHIEPKEAKKRMRGQAYNYISDVSTEEVTK